MGLLAKKGVGEPFKDPHYHALFPPAGKITHHFEAIYLAYRLYDLLNNQGYKDAKEYRRRRHGFWNSLWVLYRGLLSRNGFYSRVTPHSLKNAFDKLVRHPPSGGMARRTTRKVVKVVWDAWQVARKKDPERWTPNNFFKSKFGNQRILALAYPKVAKDLRSLARAIVGCD